MVKAFAGMAGEFVLLLMRYAAAVAAIGAFWQAGSLAVGEALLPTPAATVALFFESLSDPVYLGHVWTSFVRLFAGLTAASVPALFLGLLLGHLKKADWVGAPLVFITYPLPKIVLLPVFFLFFGLGDASRILLIALTTGYQMLVIVRASAAALDPVYETALTFMGGGRLERIRYVYLPAALPQFLTSLRVASGTAVAVLFLAESFATTTGLGYLIMDAWGVGDTLAMFNGILGMSALGLVFYAAIWAVERVLCPWTRVSVR